MDPEEQKQNRPNNKLWLSIGAVIIATLLAVWLIPSKEPEPVDIPLPAANTTPAVSAAPQQAEEPSPPVAGEGVEARQMIAMQKRGEQSLDDLYLAAQKFQRQGRLSDAYLVYFFAARKGHAPSALALGKQSDPVYYSAGTSVHEAPDMVQALKWYEAAASAGNVDAQTLLQELKLYIGDQAKTGDPVAESLSLEWNK